MGEIEKARCGWGRCGALLLAAVLILGAGAFAWWMVREHEGLRTEGLVAGIVSGLGAAACLAGVMHYLDVMATERESKGTGRWGMELLKRLVLLLQLATTGIAVAAAGILIFGF